MSPSKNPILKPLNHIENRDALLECSDASPHRAVETAQSKAEAHWPTCDAIIGNPPFLGGSKMLRELGEDYVQTLRAEYEGRVPGGADLVTYWFEKARAQIAAGNCQRAGLVATNSIRGGSNQQVLTRIGDSSKIFNAWSDEEWINEGAAVRVSLVCFGNVEGAILDGDIVEAIHADLTAGEGLNLTQAKPLKENAGVAFIGTQKSGDFDIAGDMARQWLKLPNPNGKPNSDVVRPWANGMDITRRPSDTWVIDFGIDKSEQDAALYEMPFEYVQQHVNIPLAAKRGKWKVEGKDTKHLDKQIETWHLLWCTRPEMRTALQEHRRFIGTARNGKYRLFTWFDIAVLPDCQVVAIASSHDTIFGILSSRFHELWSLRMCTWLGVGNDPRYTPTTTFETFPFPEGLTPADTASSSHASTKPLVLSSVEGSARTEVSDAIATAVQHLNQLRDNWLNPPEWTHWVRTPEEEQAGYPLRPVAKLGHEADLKKRTLTNLYNAPPAWLANAHTELDTAVAAAYGWTDYTAEMSDEEILRRLLVLNLERAE